MRIAVGSLTLSSLFNTDWWRCNFRYFRGLFRYINRRYQASVDDFEWILKNGAFAPVESLVYENLGVNYVRLGDFNRAEKYFVRALDDKSQQQNGYLFMWLGYIYLIKKRYEESLACFRNARKLSQRGYYKWLVDHGYVERQIGELQGDIRNKYEEIIRRD